MASQRGKDILLKVQSEDNATFTTVAGLRTKSIGFNAQTVDITDSESTGRWRELLDGAGLKTTSISASGIFKDRQSDERLRTMFFGGQISTCQLVIPDFGTVEGPFQITSMEYAGSHDGEVTFELALASAGALSFGAL